MSTKISLTDEELLELDGRCNQGTQKRIDHVKKRMSLRSQYDVSDGIADLLASVLEEAHENGILIYSYRRIRFCAACNKIYSFAKYSRSSKYHRRGDKNPDRPILLDAMEFARRSIRVQEYITVGCCLECLKIVKPLLPSVLEDVRAELPEELTGRKPLFKRYENRKCTQCGWEGHEGEMRKLRTVFNDGWYLGGCPNCPAVNDLGGHPIESFEGFTLIEMSKE